MDISISTARNYPKHGVEACIVETTRIFSITKIFFICGLLVTVSSPVTASEVFKVDPVHSTITFRVKHLGISFVHGRFNNPTGTITFDEKMPGSSSIKISVKVSDIDTSNAERDEDLKRKDFFDAEKYPVISIYSETFRKVSKDIYEVSCRLTLHGITRPLTVKVRHIGSGSDPWGGYRAGFETTFLIKRSDFGMTHMLGGVGDNVELTVNIEGIRK
jgi:polyisoprenoid-binding protein YceI